MFLHALQFQKQVLGAILLFNEKIPFYWHRLDCVCVCFLSSMVSPGRMHNVWILCCIVPTIKYNMHITARSYELYVVRSFFK